MPTLSSFIAAACNSSTVFAIRRQYARLFHTRFPGSTQLTIPSGSSSGLAVLARSTPHSTLHCAIPFPRKSAPCRAVCISPINTVLLGLTGPTSRNGISTDFAVFSQCTLVTNGQMDGRTERRRNLTGYKRRAYLAAACDVCAMQPDNSKLFDSSCIKSHPGIAYLCVCVVATVG